MISKKYRDLVQQAKQAKHFAYAPYSKFRVGVALLAADGTVFTGCNIENSSFGLTVCAERTAVFKAISEGATSFAAMAIVSDSKKFTPPCGACRQVLLELAGNIDFIMVDGSDKTKIVKLVSLLPSAFTTNDLITSYKSNK
ncbi:MAG TPA: cytidine deaminase [Bacteroidota bacterium]|nr:cytidine deaminase [Bacteroidota bacterium]